VKEALGQPARKWLRHAARAALGLGVVAVFLAFALGIGEDGIDLAEVLARVGRPEVLTLAAVGAALALALPALGPLPASALTLAAVAPIAYLGYAVPAATRLISLEQMLLAVLLLFAINVLVGHLLEARDRQRLVERFGQYVPPHLAQALAEGGPTLAMEGESREMTVIFADIRNFTAIAETLDPRQLVQLLNAVFTPLTEVVYRHLGTIDKYIGDAIMAFWGAPLRDPGHARRAVEAALEMQAVLADLRPELRRRGLPEVHMGIGINSGPMSVGNMGSRFRVAYTVVGDRVNLAARVQTLTRELEAGVLVTGAVRDATPGIAYREVGTLRVRGKSEVVRLYQPVSAADSLTPEVKEWLAEHARALESYYARRWDEATTRFGRLWAAHADDRLYEIYLNNIRVFTREASPSGWAGELSLEAPDGFGWPAARTGS
jgi:adenylate cyclase